MHNLNGIQKWVDLECGFMPHLSPSKISLFNNNLSMFILRYGHDKKVQPNPAMDRGTVCEDAIVSVLLGDLTLKQSIYKACESYNELVHQNNEDHYKQIEFLPEIITNAYEALESYGPPEFINGRQQQKIQYELTDDKNNWTADMIGYLDLVYPEQGLIIDLKTTLRMPSVMSWDHLLQQAIYQNGKSNYQVKFLYVTPKKAELKDETRPGILEEAKVIINKMNTFCFTLSPSQARRCIPLQNDYYFKDQQQLREFYNGQ